MCIPSILPYHPNSCWCVRIIGGTPFPCNPLCILRLAQKMILLPTPFSPLPYESPSCLSSWMSLLFLNQPHRIDFPQVNTSMLNVRSANKLVVHMEVQANIETYILARHQRCTLTHRDIEFGLCRPKFLGTSLLRIIGNTVEARFPPHSFYF